MGGIEAECSRLKPGTRGKHLSSQFSWAAAWLLVTCSSSIYLVVDELRPCVLWPPMIGLGGSVAVFDMVNMVLLIGSWCYSRKWVWKVKDKIMLYCFGEVICKQGFATGIWYYLYNALALGLIVSMCISGLMVSESEFRYGDRALEARLRNYFSIFLRILIKK